MHVIINFHHMTYVIYGNEQLLTVLGPVLSIKVKKIFFLHFFSHYSFFFALFFSNCHRDSNISGDGSSGGGGDSSGGGSGGSRSSSGSSSHRSGGINKVQKCVKIDFFSIGQAD